MSTAEAIIAELARLCEQKERIWLRLADAQRARDYVSTPAELLAIQTLHGEHLGAIDAWQAARGILNLAQQVGTQSEAVIA